MPNTETRQERLPPAELWSRGLEERSFFGRDATFHHLGLAVPSLSAAVPLAEPVVNEREGVSMAFVRVHGIVIELLEPLWEASPVMASLRSGSKLLHVCYEVADLAEAVRLSRTAGFHRLGLPLPSPAFGGRRVVWVYSKQYGLVELLERAQAG